MAFSSLSVGQPEGNVLYLTTGCSYGRSSDRLGWAKAKPGSGKPSKCKSVYNFFSFHFEVQKQVPLDVDGGHALISMWDKHVERKVWNVVG